MNVTRKKVGYTQNDLAKAIDFITGRQTVKIQQLQRKLSVDVNTAFEIMDTLVDLSFIEPFKGANFKRKVLI